MQSLKEVWAGVRDFARKEISEVAYDSWINCLDPVEIQNDTVILCARSSFHKKTVERYIPLLCRSFEQVLGFPIEIKIVTEEEIKVPTHPQTESEILKNPDDFLKSYSKAEYEYTFGTFIVGSSNKFAHAACQAVAANPAGAYNPLFIYGVSGLGKTHLLNAIRYDILKTNPSANILYVKSDDFTNEMVDSIREHKNSEFRNKYRLADVLLIDDIQFIAGKESTQEEFFHTFNSLYEAKKQIVLTSDRAPKEIQTLEDRLRTRFEWGLIADIQLPDFETRIAIIKRKAELLNIVIPNDVTEYLANRLKNNIRQLEGAVKKIKAYNLLAGDPPSIALAQIAIRDILNDNQPVPITIERIVNEVCRTFSVTPEEIKGKMRSAHISIARQVAMYIVRQVTQMSLPAIGENFGGRDHSTVVYALQKIEADMQVNSHFKGTIEDIIKNIQTH